MKKVISIIISVMMVMTMVPTMAFAASVQECDRLTCTHEAAVGLVHYDTLEEAVVAAGDDSKVEVLNDVTLEQPINVQKKILFWGLTRDDGKKPVISGANGFFVQEGNAEYTISNIDFVHTGNDVDHGFFIKHLNNHLNINGCSFTANSSIQNLVQGLGSKEAAAATNKYSIFFNENTVNLNARVMFLGIGNGSEISNSIIDAKAEKYNGGSQRTSLFSVIANSGKGDIYFSDNEFMNANRALGIDHSTLSGSEIYYDRNKLIDVRYGFELSGTNNAGDYDLNHNYYVHRDLNNVPQAMKVQDADKSGDKFAFGDGSVEYVPEKDASKVKNDVYFIRDTMNPEDLNNYVAPSVPSTPSKPEVAPPTVGNTGNIETTVKPDATGKVETTVPSETITESLDKVTQTPSATAKPEVEIVVKEEAGTSSPAKTFDVKVPAEAVEKIAKTEDATLKVTTSVGTVKLDNKALNNVVAEAKGEAITISVENKEVSKIANEAQKETIATLGKDEHVFELIVKAGERKIHQLGGEATFEISYELKPGELAENVRVFYIDNEGKKHNVAATYDEKTQKILMTTDHFSIFAVSYVDAPSKVKSLKAKNENGKAALRWSRAINGAEGYRIYRAKTKDGKYTAIAWVKNGKAKTFKEKSKKTKKTYYYKVRAYKTVDGKKVWGEYSPVKKVKF